MRIITNQNNYNCVKLTTVIKNSQLSHCRHPAVNDACYYEQNPDPVQKP